MSNDPHRRTRLPGCPTLCATVGLVICSMSDSWPRNVQTNDDGIVVLRVGGGKREEWGHLPRGEQVCLHVRRRWAQARTHRRHVCPPQASSRVGLACTQMARTPPLPSPTDNEISPPCVSSCPSSKDSPPSHTKPLTGVCAPEGYVEQDSKKSIPANLASQYRHVGLPVQETQRNTNTDLHDKHTRSGAIGTARRVMSTSGSGSQPTRILRPPRRHSRRSDQQRRSERMPHRRHATRGSGALSEADGRSSCIVSGIGDGCATRRRQRAGNRGICFGRRVPHVTRAVVRAFEGLRRTKTFDGIRESVE